MTDEAPAPAVPVRDAPARHRYEIEIDGAVAVLEYQRRPGSIALIHTEVPPALRGRGLADQLARAALDQARAQGLKVVPICPFVKKFLERHPEYQSLVL
jgi:predicted GNAT family acetyltransferase